MDAISLTDGQVVLDVPTEADLDRITKCCQDPDVQRWTSVPSPYTRQDSETFLRDWVRAAAATGTGRSWAIRFDPTGPVMGMIGLMDIAHGAAEVGYWVAADARGKQVAAKALRLVVNHAFDPAGLALKQLRWEAQVGNWASRRAAWRVGFVVEGTVRGHILQRGEWRDAWIATLLVDDPREPNTTWYDVPTLSGQSVTMRRFVESDVAAVVEACTDPLTRQWLGQLPQPYTRDVAREFISSREENHATGKSVNWAAALPEGGPAIGSFSLMRLADRSAEIGYWLHPRARGQGVATEAVRLITEHAFAPGEQGGLGLVRLVLCHAVGNDASARVAERAGFTRTGLEHRATPIGDGTLSDAVWYERLAP